MPITAGPCTPALSSAPPGQPEGAGRETSMKLGCGCGPLSPSMRTAASQVAYFLIRSSAARKGGDRPMRLRRVKSSEFAAAIARKAPETLTAPSSSDQAFSESVKSCDGSRYGLPCALQSTSQGLLFLDSPSIRGVNRYLRRPSCSPRHLSRSGATVFGGVRRGRSAPAIRCQPRGARTCSHRSWPVLGSSGRTKRSFQCTWLDRCFTVIARHAPGVASAEIHLVTRLSAKRRMEKHPGVLLTGFVQDLPINRPSSLLRPAAPPSTPCTPPRT